ncbi:MAG: hypothetical protein K2W82_12195 [Candidatus Obscuribacterales bacterium]|nr:hypothetical protein [Candidatus Obscuribacterales bacterium]
MSDSDEPSQNPSTRLAETILELELLSAAQVELALADHEINDLPLEEVLVARGWLSKQQIHSIAPWLKPDFKPDAPPPPEPPNPALVTTQDKIAKVKTPEHPLAKLHPEKPKQASAPEESSKANQGKTADNLAAYKEIYKKAFDREHDS